MRKTLVFYLGRAPKGKKTDWVMHEFRLQPPPHHHHVDDWVLCRVFCKTREIVDDEDDDDIDYYFGELQTVSTKKKINKVVRHELALSSCCSSLPQLMEPPSLFNNDNQQLQVPCFSTILSNPQFADDHLIIDPHYLFTTTTTSTTTIHHQPIIPPASRHSSSQYCCENKEQAAVKSILSSFHNSHCHLQDSTPTSLTSLGEGISDQCFLSDAALPCLWSGHCFFTSFTPKPSILCYDTFHATSCSACKLAPILNSY